MVKQELKRAKNLQSADRIAGTSPNQRVSSPKIEDTDKPKFGMTVSMAVASSLRFSSSRISEMNASWCSSSAPTRIEKALMPSMAFTASRPERLQIGPFWACSRLAPLLRDSRISQFRGRPLLVSPPACLTGAANFCSPPCQWAGQSDTAAERMSCLGCWRHLAP